MKPLITSRPLTDFPKSRQAALCLCNNKCKDVLLFVQDEFVYQVCEKGAVQYANEILKYTGQIADPKEWAQTDWTPSQIQQLKDYVNSVGGVIPYGGYSQLGQHLKKTRTQLRDKVKVLRKNGELPEIKQK